MRKVRCRPHQEDSIAVDETRDRTNRDGVARRRAGDGMKLDLEVVSCLLEGRMRRFGNDPVKESATLIAKGESENA